MNRQEARSKGGKVSAAKQRELAIREYYQNPQICLQCKQIIEIPEGVKVSEIRKKKYCNSSCFASHSNTIRERVRRTLLVTCICGIPIIQEWDTKSNRAKRRVRCDGCKYKKNLPSQSETTTKGELFSNRKNWQSARGTIQKHARLTYDRSGKPKACFKCEYTQHYEVAHIVPVSTFSSETLISTINHIDNLVALCPTHHWEFDNGILLIAGSK